MVNCLFCWNEAWLGYHCIFQIKKKSELIKLFIVDGRDGGTEFFRFNFLLPCFLFSEKSFFYSFFRKMISHLRLQWCEQIQNDLKSGFCVYAIWRSEEIFANGIFKCWPIWTPKQSKKKSTRQVKDTLMTSKNVYNVVRCGEQKKKEKTNNLFCDIAGRQ